MRVDRSRRLLAALLWSSICVGAATPARAQTPARFSLDSAISVDLFRGQSTVDRPNIVVDVTLAGRLNDGWMFYIRPWLRQPRAPGWDKEIYQAAMQYSRPGPISTRVEFGYIASPIGLGLLDSSPEQNPMIGPHYSYLLAMPAFDPGAPRVSAIASSYPFGSVVTLSTTKWDARAALINAAPTRGFELGSDDNPKRSATIVVGGGVTPRTGLRLGGSVARGQYATEEEIIPSGAAGRAVTMMSVEGEFAFAHTKISGEVTDDLFDKAGAASDTAQAWFIQAAQTVTPRLFVAARQEGVRAPVAMSGAMKGTRPFMHYSEATVGYRLTTDFTLRGSFLARKSFTRTLWDQQLGVSLVWARRWW